MRYSGSGRPGFVRGRHFIAAPSNIAITMPPGFVTLQSGQSVLVARRGASAILVFAPVKGEFAADPRATIARMMARLSKPGRVETFAGGRGALAIGTSAAGKKLRLAVLRSQAAAFVVLMLEQRSYHGIDRDFRMAARSIRTLRPFDRELARPWRISIVRADGPAAFSRYVRESGGGAVAREIMLAINGLQSPAQVRPGMRLKVLAFGR